MDINLNVNVKLGCSDELKAVLLNALTAITTGSVLTQAPAEDLSQPAAKPARAKKQKKEEPKPEPISFEPEKAPVDDLPFSDEPEKAPEKKTETKDEESEREPAETGEETSTSASEPPALSVQDLRDAMKRTRDKFGDTEDADNKELHKSLTRCFIAIAKDLGADKPSLLPEGQVRWDFTAALDRITVTDNQAAPF